MFTKKGIYTYNGEDYEFNYKNNLTVSEKMFFVNKMVETTIVDGDNGMRYYSFLRTIMFDYLLVKILTDVEMPTDIDDIEVFMNNTNLFSFVCNEVSDQLITELNGSVNDNIEIITGIKVDSIEKSVVSFANMLAGKVDGLSVEKIMNEYFKSDAYSSHLTEVMKKSERRAEKVTSNLSDSNIKFGNNVLNLVNAAKSGVDK